VVREERTILRRFSSLTPDLPVERAWFWHGMAHEEHVREGQFRDGDSD
jgi:hypothetical protein